MLNTMRSIYFQLQTASPRYTPTPAAHLVLGLHSAVSKIHLTRSAPTAPSPSPPSGPVRLLFYS